MDWSGPSIIHTKAGGQNEPLWDGEVGQKWVSLLK